MKESIEIHYADDDSDDRGFFQNAVNKLEETHKGEIKLKLYEDGDSLLNLIKDKKLKNGIVFLDINMRGRSGFETLAEIRSNTVNNDVPVIMYSTSSNVISIDTSMALGASMYVVKPTYIQEIIDTISKVISMDWTTFKRNKNNFILKNL